MQQKLLVEQTPAEGQKSNPMTYSQLANRQVTLATLKQFGLYAKYKLGQNFLVDDAVIGGILNLAQLEHDDVVLEVGPGIGTLSTALLDHARALIAIERDSDLMDVLTATLSQHGDKVAVINADALTIDVNHLAEKTEAMGVPLPNKLVSNLPYGVAATVILLYAERLASLERMVVMVQAEVADRICAKPGTKIYGAYTIKLSLYYTPTGRFEVGPNSFMPEPRVNSAVLRLEPTALQGDSALAARVAPMSSEDKTFACSVIDAAFQQRRKTIRNSMAHAGFEKAKLDQAFEMTGIPPTIRAEMLSSEDFIRLASALKTLKNPT